MLVLFWVLLPLEAQPVRGTPRVGILCLGVLIVVNGGATIADEPSGEIRALPKGR